MCAFLFYEGKIQIVSGSTLYKSQKSGIIDVSMILAMKGTAHDRAARSEPEDGASPDAAIEGESSRSSGSNPPQPAEVGPVGRARYSAHKRARSIGCANLGGTAKRLRPMIGRGLFYCPSLYS